MTTVSTTTAGTVATASAPAKRGFGALGSADFLRLMTTQMQQQDPFDPMDNKDMLAQMAQFSSLSEISDVNSGIASLNTAMNAVASKLDAMLAAQEAAAAQTPPAPTA